MTRWFATGIAGLSVVADSLSAIKYARVKAVRNDKGIVTDYIAVSYTHLTEKARKLFREMIQKASNEVGFEAEDIPLMVEAIPLSSESIMLVITKIEDPEELDTRFAKFSPFTDDNQNSLVSQLASEFLEGAPDSLNLSLIHI